MNLKLNLDFKKLLPMLRKLLPYGVGLVLIGVFGYTAYLVNATLNVQPADPATLGEAQPKVSISFDKKTIEAVKKLEVVTGDVPTGGLGTHDPFK